MRAQEAVRLAVFLMSHGANTNAVNNVGETPLDIASRMTADFPKAQRLLLSILDPGEYGPKGVFSAAVPSIAKLGSTEEFFIGTPGSLPPHALGTRGTPETRPQNRTAPPVTSAGGRGSPAPIPPVTYDSRSGLPFQTAPIFAPGRASRRPCDKGITNELYRRGRGQGSTGGEERQKAPRGMVFKDMKMCRSSLLLAGGCAGVKAAKNRGRRPTTCVLGVKTAPRGISARGRPVTTAGESASGARWPSFPQKGTEAKRRGLGIGQSRDASGVRATHPTRGTAPHKRSPAVPDCEARREISQWLQQAAQGTPPVAPPARYNVTGYLTEKSPFVATGSRVEVYRALRLIKGGGPGELISVDKLRYALCRTGQPLLPEEMDSFLRKADPGNTGYVTAS